MCRVTFPLFFVGLSRPDYFLKIINLMYMGHITRLQSACHGTIPVPRRAEMVQALCNHFSPPWDWNLTVTSLFSAAAADRKMIRRCRRLLVRQAPCSGALAAIVVRLCEDLLRLWSTPVQSAFAAFLTVQYNCLMASLSCSKVHLFIF